MTLSPRNQQIVDHLVGARQKGHLWTPSSLEESFTLEDGYAVQDGVGSALGWFPDGAPKAWKAGGKPFMTAAPLPQVLTEPAMWSGAGHHDLVMEAELAFRLASTPAKDQSIESCLGTMCVSIEIVATRITDGLKAPLAWKLADQLVHASLVIGAEIPYTARDWSQQPCRVLVNGVTRAEAQGSHPNGDPMLPVSWLAGHAAERTGGLRTGDLVTTGAWLLLPVQRGDSIEVQFEGIGKASVRIGA